MIHDEDLKSSIDYSEGQKEAAHRILIELVNLLRELTRRDAYEQIKALIKLI